jgi:hypothetical protein
VRKDEEEEQKRQLKTALEQEKKQGKQAEIEDVSD